MGLSIHWLRRTTQVSTPAMLADSMHTDDVKQKPAFQGAKDTRPPGNASKDATHRSPTL